MADYIKRRDAIDYIESFVRMNKYYHPYSKSTTIPITEAIARIDLIPSADVQPVVHGEWIEMRDPWGDDPYYNCSCCGDAFVLMEGTPKDNNYNFCPNCGADMRGET